VLFKISISNKCASFELSIHQRIQEKKSNKKIKQNSLGELKETSFQNITKSYQPQIFEWLCTSYY